MDFLKRVLAWFKDLFGVEASQPPVKPSISTPSVPIVEPQPDGNFDFARKYLLPNEAGFSNHPSDRGGATNFGITQATLSKWRGYDVSVAEVKSMKFEESTDIYRAWYWQQPHFDKIKSRPISTCLFDQGVVNGPAVAIKYGQLAANNCGAALSVDSIVGPLTIAALEKVDVKKFLTAYRDLLQDHYDSIVAHNPSQDVFYNGWMNRANRLLTLVTVAS